jgi:hypothetical protein
MCGMLCGTGGHDMLANKVDRSEQTCNTATHLGCVGSRPACENGRGRRCDDGGGGRYLRQAQHDSSHRVDVGVWISRGVNVGLVDVSKGVRAMATLRAL